MSKTATLKLTLIFFAAALVGYWPALKTAAALMIPITIGLKDAKALAPGSLRFWFFPIIFILLAPFMAGIPDSVVMRTGYSLQQLFKGLGFLLNAYAFMTIVVYVSRAFSMQEIVTWSEKTGFKTMGLRMGLALNSAKILRRTITETWENYAVARPSVKEKLRELPVLGGAMLRNCALIAERISVLFHIRNIQI